MEAPIQAFAPLSKREKQMFKLALGFDSGNQLICAHCVRRRRYGLVRRFAAVVPVLAISLGLAITGGVNAFANSRAQVVRAGEFHSGGKHRHGHQVVDRQIPPIGYAGWSYPAGAWSSQARPHFVRGRRIVGEDCDMPTSTCSDRFRD
jgi:hypothetical protein